jgi:hypothetical protein
LRIRTLIVAYRFISVTENKRMCCSEAVEVFVIEIRSKAGTFGLREEPALKIETTPGSQFSGKLAVVDKGVERGIDAGLPAQADHSPVPGLEFRRPPLFF